MRRVRLAFWRWAYGLVDRRLMRETIRLQQRPAYLQAQAEFSSRWEQAKKERRER